MESKLKIYNSLTRKKEEFVPLIKGHVGMYVCGPTVYSDVHLGNVRTNIMFDVVRRYLSYLGYKVRYVRNITDVGHLVNDADEGEDKIAKKARLENLEPMEVVQRYTNGFHDVERTFNNLKPSIEPTATGHLLEQIKMVQQILEAGLAYEVNGSVYFDVEKYNKDHNYGKLSGRVLEDLIESGRDLDGQDEKRKSVDFALWKKADPSHIMRWDSPWGEGFPGWHLECSVMSTKYLGKTFDIHGGGMDLKFPHHECEIAQSIAADGVDPVRYWMHSGMLNFEGKKMSKSLGNSILPGELISGDHRLLEKGYSPMTIRFLMLQSHYSSELDLSNKALQDAEKGLRKLSNALQVLRKMSPGDGKIDDDLEKAITDLCAACSEHMNDDFNTAKCVASLFELTSIINAMHAKGLVVSSISKNTLTLLQETFDGFYFDVLGLKLEESANNEVLDGVMNVLIEMRKQARVDKNWALSDQIRDELQKNNVVLKDGKEGTTYEIVQ